jgi:hypothetical protein
MVWQYAPLGEIPNPMCACGCGYEVALPWNKYIQGHFGAVRLDRSVSRKVVEMLHRGESTYKIARIVGRTPSTVLMWRQAGTIPQQKRARAIFRSDYIEDMTKFRKLGWELLAHKMTTQQQRDFLKATNLRRMGCSLPTRKSDRGPGPGEDSPRQT